MNYYPFHLGDYAAHTAHLEPLEDLAYRRMLDLYYRTEKPLPECKEDLARLIRMKAHVAEISDVLGEFFTLTDDGWRHSRCDAELARMKDKQAKAKASAQASVNARSTNAQRTLPVRSAGAELPTPTPTPEEIQSLQRAKEARELEERETAESARALLEAEGFKPTPAGAACRAMREAGLMTANPGDPRLLTLLEQGATVDELTGISAEAVAGGKGFAWVLTVLAARRADAAQIRLAPPPAVVDAGRVAADSTAALLEAQKAHAERSATPEAHAARVAAMAKARAARQEAA